MTSDQRASHGLFGLGTIVGDHRWCGGSVPRGAERDVRVESAAGSAKTAGSGLGTTANSCPSHLVVCHVRADLWPGPAAGTVGADHQRDHSSRLCAGQSVSDPAQTSGSVRWLPSPAASSLFGGDQLPACSWLPQFRLNLPGRSSTAGWALPRSIRSVACPHESGAVSNLPARPAERGYRPGSRCRAVVPGPR